LPTNVWILSKGRPSNLSSKLFSSAGIEHTIFVEPQDEAAYRAVLLPHASLHILPQDNGGICFVRNHMLETARAMGDVPYWMCDDDIKSMAPTELVGGVPRKRKGSGPSDVAACMDSIERGGLAHPEIAFAAPAHVANLWAFDFCGMKLDYPSFFINWVHPGRIHRDLRWHVPGRDDTLFAGELTLTGGRTAWFTTVAVDVAPIGFSPGAGGMAEYYARWDEKVIPGCQGLEACIEGHRAKAVDGLCGKDRKRAETMKLVRWFKPKWSRGGDYNLPRWAALRKLKLMCDAAGLKLEPAK
jgi:hypothetical protein